MAIWEVANDKILKFQFSYLQAGTVNQTIL